MYKLTALVEGMLLPFGLGVALSYGLYQEFVDPAIPYRNFMIFIGSSILSSFPGPC